MKLRTALLPLVSLFAIPIAAACSNPSGGEEASGADLKSDAPTLAADWKTHAGQYLDARAGQWLSNPPHVGNIACAMSCHTTFPYVVTRAIFTSSVPSQPQADLARARFEQRVQQAVANTAVPFYGSGTSAKVTQSHATESILNAAALSFDDLQRSGTLSTSAQSALGKMWSTQRPDGAWDWLEFGLEPWERGNDWGTAMAALLVGSIPANTSAAQAAGTQKMVSYLQTHLQTMALHDRIMVLWASSRLDGLLTADQQKAVAAEIQRTQLSDGGYSFGAWGRGSIAASVASTSDGYATAYATLAICTSTPDGKTRPEVQRGLAWLSSHQQQDGSWPGQSVNSRNALNKGFMTDAATAYATLALTACSQ